MKAYFIALPIMALALSCRSFDEVNASTATSPITYKVGDVTKAKLTTSSNLAGIFPEMAVIAMQGSTMAFTDSFPTSQPGNPYSTHYWGSSPMVFYSFPSGSIEPRAVSADGLSFAYTVATDATNTPDIVAARTQASPSNPVQFTYKHIFVAVNIIYKSLEMAHNITRAAVVSQYTTGVCDVTADGIGWTSLENVKDIADNTHRIISANNQEVNPDGSKFMTIPGQRILVELDIDGKTVSADTGERTFSAGDIVNFYIEDNYTITTSTGAESSSGISMNPDGTYKVSLEAYVTGEYEHSSHDLSVATDFVLVLDNSQSMTWNLSGGTGGTSRLKMLKQGASVFVDSVAMNAARHNLQHRVGIISFGHYNFPLSGYNIEENSNYLLEIPITAGSKGVNTQVIKSMSSVTDDITGIKAAIESLDAQGMKTAADSGMELAWLMTKTKCRPEAAKTVIFFTDGKPEYSGGDNSWTSSTEKKTKCQIANDAVHYAHLCKQQGVSVFTIGIFTSDSELCKRYAGVLSSNYPDAESVFRDKNSTSAGNTGALRSDGKEFFFYVDEYYRISDAFRYISDGISQPVSHIDVHEDAYIKGIFSDAFVMDAGSLQEPGAVSFYTVSQLAYDSSTDTMIWDDQPVDITSQIKYSFDADTNSMSISGFDYGSNFCTIDAEGPFTGKKLLIVFNSLTPNSAKSGSGMNHVLGYNTALYDRDGTLISMFPPLYVNL